MDQATRAKALGYAAKVAIGAAFLAACGGSESQTTQDDNASAPSDDEIIKGDPACKDGLAKLKAAFPDGDKQWYSHAKADPKFVGDTNVTACCESMLKGGNEDLTKVGKFRTSGCCAADFTSEKAPIGVTACTPWGPPVPPSMKWVA
jgi:hypothetical protein